MGIEIIRKSADFVTRSTVLNTLKALELLPKTSVEAFDERRLIAVTNARQYVPDFRLEWCSQNNHFRVYIFVAEKAGEKQNAGYNICNIANSLAASGFVAMYTFLHKHRGMNKATAS